MPKRRRARIGKPTRAGSVGAGARGLAGQDAGAAVERRRRGRRRRAAAGGARGRTPGRPGGRGCRPPPGPWPAAVSVPGSTNTARRGVPGVEALPVSSDDEQSIPARARAPGASPIRWRGGTGRPGPGPGRGQEGGSGFRVGGRGGEGLPGPGGHLAFRAGAGNSGHQVPDREPLIRVRGWKGLEGGIGKAPARGLEAAGGGSGIPGGW